MSDREIVIKIQDGKLDIEALGYKGEGCDEATAFLESLGTLTDSKKKKEYRRGAQTQRQTRRQVQ